MQVTYGSLCTGYDGIGLGLRLAGMGIEPLWVAENEEAMARVLKREHPDVPNVGDIKVAPWDLAPHVRLMSSGDPCQSISIAGRQAGRDDPRFLWPWVRAAYREVRPDVLFFENVANIVSHDKGRTMAERFEHLREDGYEVRWCVLGACAVGAPHHRHRWYAVAVRVGQGAPLARRVGGKVAICGAPRNSGRMLLASPKASDTFGSGVGRTERGEKPWHDLPSHVAMLPTPNARDGGPRGTPTVEHAARRAADPMRSLNLEDAIVLLPTPMADRSGNNRGGSAGREGQPVRPSLDSVHALLPTPTVSNAQGNRYNGESPPRLLLPGVAIEHESTWGKYAAAIALWEQVTGVPAPVPTEPNSRGDGRRLNPALPEWMMGLRPGLLTGELSRNDALKGAGNGVVPQAAAAAWRLLTAPPND
jgi:DNA (cytosine-5)-methyltransferase 1